MKWQSWTIPISLIILLTALGYSVFVLMQNQVNYVFFIPALWGILLPLISDFPHNLTYLLSVPAPFFGTLFVLMLISSKYFGFSFPLYLLLVLLSAVIISVFHAATRWRTMILKISMASTSRVLISISSIIFLALAMVVLNPSIASTTIQNELFYFTAALFGYIASSMLYVNSNFRRYELNKRVGTTNLNKLLSEKWGKIEKKFPTNQKDVDALQYYFRDSYNSFLEGNFEKSFISGYKVIREETVVDPRKIVDDKREGKPSFSEIRTTLVHSRRGDSHVEIEKINKALKNLSHDCLDLLEREVIYIQKVAEDPLTSKQEKDNVPFQEGK